MSSTSKSQVKKIRRSLGDWVRSHREDKNLSQDGLAKLVDMERQQIYRIENGLSGTKQETIIKLAAALEANKDEGLSIAAGLLPDETESTRYKRTLEALARSGTLSDKDDEFLAGLIDQMEKRNRGEN